MNIFVLINFGVLIELIFHRYVSCYMDSLSTNGNVSLVLRKSQKWKKNARMFLYRTHTSKSSMMQNFFFSFLSFSYQINVNRKLAHVCMKDWKSLPFQARQKKIQQILLECIFLFSFSLFLHHYCLWFVKHSTLYRSLSLFFNKL